MNGGDAPPRFLVDHMVLKLGKYLRILGYDATWDTAVRTHELIRRANGEGRVFLTRNTKLAAQYPPVDHVLVLRADDPVAQLARVVEELGLDTEARQFSRCIRCNVVLAEVEDPTSVADHVPARVRARYRRFWTCPSCATIFWRGTHVTNTRTKLGYENGDEAASSP